MITPIQFRMARAALALTTREMGHHLDISATAISKYERGLQHVLSVETMLRIEEWLRDSQIFFGPGHGVCVGQDVFAQERWFTTACFKLLQEAGITPSSSDLIAASQRIAETSVNVNH